MTSIFRTLLLVALSVHAAAACATSVTSLMDGTIVQYGEKGGVPYLAQWTDGTWTPIEVAPGLAPAKGEFEGVCADAQGNLFVSFTDATNEKKKTSGLLARTGGTWAMLGTFDRNWSAGSTMAALAPDAVYLRVHLVKERTPAVAHWNGKAFALVPLPAGMEEVDDLHVHDAALVMLADGKGPSGTYRDGTLCYRLAGGAWEQMGAPAAGNMELLLTAAGATLLRLGRAAEQWNGTAWEEAFTFKNSSLDGFRITDACASPQGELYLVLDDTDSKAHLACWPGRGGMLWFKGTEGSSRRKYGAYDLFCDKEGALHVGDDERYTFADFDYAADGYPTKDDKAADVLQFYRGTIFKLEDFATRLSTVDQAHKASGSATDAAAVKDVSLEGLVMCNRTAEQLKALGLPPGRNRLHDKYATLLKEFGEMLYIKGERATDPDTWTNDDAKRQRFLDSTQRFPAALKVVTEEADAYPRRNGLD